MADGKQSADRTIYSGSLMDELAHRDAARAVASPRVDGKQALDRMMAAVDDLMRSAGSVLCAQPHGMTEASQRLERMLKAMQDSLLRDGGAIHTALTREELTPHAPQQANDRWPMLPPGLRWLTDYEIRCINYERFGCTVGSKDIRWALADAIALMKRPAPQGIPTSEDPDISRPKMLALEATAGFDSATPERREEMEREFLEQCRNEWRAANHRGRDGQ